MNNDKFQELVLERFEQMDKRFDKRFEQMDKRQDRFEELVIKQFAKMLDRFDDVDAKLIEHDERFDRLDKETELIARQVGKIIKNEDEVVELFIKRRQKEKAAF